MWSFAIAFSPFPSLAFFHGTTDPLEVFFFFFFFFKSLFSSPSFDPGAGRSFPPAIEFFSAYSNWISSFVTL